VPELIEAPSIVEAAGEPPKTIREHIGRVATGDARVSVAHMTSPTGWAEPGQRPEFDEFTVVLTGMVLVEHEGGRLEVHAGQAVHTKAGEWVRFSSPGPDGADYIAVCLPAFAPDIVHRDE
jgi:mannose-6-phosphate isomerase-like protein (cupin superfamily)